MPLISQVCPRCGYVRQADVDAAALAESIHQAVLALSACAETSGRGVCRFVPLFFLIAGLGCMVLAFKSGAALIGILSLLLLLAAAIAFFTRKRDHEEHSVEARLAFEEAKMKVQNYFSGSLEMEQLIRDGERKMATAENAIRMRRSRENRLGRTICAALLLLFLILVLLS